MLCEIMEALLHTYQASHFDKNESFFPSAKTDIVDFTNGLGHGWVILQLLDQDSVVEVLKKYIIWNWSPHLTQTPFYLLQTLPCRATLLVTSTSWTLRPVVSFPFLFPVLWPIGVPCPGDGSFASVMHSKTRFTWLFVSGNLRKGRPSERFIPRAAFRRLQNHLMPRAVCGLKLDNAFRLLKVNYFPLPVIFANVVIDPSNIVWNPLF